MQYGEASEDVVVVGIGPGPIGAGGEHGQRQDGDRGAAFHALRLRDIPLLTGLGLIAPVAGVGLLYLLRSAGIADVGPRPAGALPLEQLAAADAQPLLRMALAWLPVGLATGAALAAFCRSSRLVALAFVALLAGAVVVISAGVSDALANNEPLTYHLGTPLGAAGTWVSLALLIIGAAVGEGLAAAAMRAPSAA